MAQDKVRFGVIGIGNMGSSHVTFINQGKDCVLTAVCDCNPKAFDRIPAAIREKVKCYDEASKLINDPEVDVVVVAVPHYSHPDMAIMAMQAGKHVLVEKPLAVHKAEAERVIAEAKKYPNLVKALMLNQRTIPAHIKVKQLIDSGELGQIRRVCWTITDWFRTQYYYDSGDWRASWRGEGGGVLTNQCPHQLDLFQWFFGLPSKVRASAKLGKFHNIEVEDEVNAYMEYADGMTANFIASTGECPGVNRLEITAERGLLILENRNEISFRRNEIEMTEYSRTATKGFAPPAVWDCKIPAALPTVAGHQVIIENVAAAVLGKAQLISPLEEGIRGLELGNAMLYSGLNDCTVELPLDSAAYAGMLDKLVENSRYQKKTVKAEGKGDDFSGSY